MSLFEYWNSFPTAVFGVAMGSSDIVSQGSDGSITVKIPAMEATLDQCSVECTDGILSVVAVSLGKKTKHEYTVASSYEVAVATLNRGVLTVSLKKSGKDANKISILES
jgi:HSP20 family molecular chaperone IbpA